MNSTQQQDTWDQLIAQLDPQTVTQMYAGQGSNLVLIIGKSGRGKSTGIADLPEAETAIIQCVRKPLPFLGAPTRFNTARGNLFVETDAAPIIRRMQTISRDGKYRFLVIDDAQYVMAKEFMDNAMIKGYDKFSVMARNFWNILWEASRLRDGMIVFLLAHEEDTGVERKLKTLGKLLDEKLTPEGLSTVVLYADMLRSDDKAQYYFLTQSDGYTNAKSPMGMFPYTIPNKLGLVAARIDEYYQGIPLEESKLDFGTVLQPKPPTGRAPAMRTIS